MRLDKMWKTAGNIDRITELSDAGFGHHAISGIFKDDGINISPEFVFEIQNGAEELSKKGLPKAVCKKLIASQKEVPISFAR